MLISFIFPCTTYAATITTLTGNLEMLSSMDLQYGKENFLAVKIDAPMKAFVDDYVSPTPAFEQINVGDNIQLTFSSSDQASNAQDYLGRQITVLCDDVSEAVTAHQFTPIICSVKSFSLVHSDALSGTSTLKHPKQPTAKGDKLVDGAIVCPSLDVTMWLYKKIGAAKVAQNYMPPQNRQMVILQNGYDPWEEPKPTEYRCQFVPSGTPMNVKWEGGIPVVWGKLKDGRPFAGVTSLTMVDY